MEGSETLRSQIRSSVSSRRSFAVITPARIAAAYVAFIAAAELKFRHRSLTESLQGAVDAQVVVELAVFGLLLGWVAAVVSQSQQKLASLKHLGPGLKALLAVAGVVLVSSLYAPSIRSVVKAAEFVGLALLTIVAYQYLRQRSTSFTTEFWVWIRRWLWVMVGIATVVTILAFVPPHTIIASLTQTHIRFNLMAAHPIATGGMLGMGLLLLAGAWIAVPDSWLVAPRRPFIVLLIALVALALLFATKARGALLAMVAGTGVLTVISPNRRRRSIAGLLVWAALVLPLLGIGDQALTRTIIRNQTAEQLMSLSDRTLLFEAAWPLVLERPFLGHGFLASASVFTDLFPWAGEGHNVILEAAFSFGLIGSLTFLVLWIQIGRQLWRGVRSRVVETRVLANEALALSVFALLLSVVGDSFAGIPGFETVALMWIALLSDLVGAGNQQSPGFATFATRRC